MTLLITLAIVVWWCSGAGSFIYWWTNDWPLTTSEIPLIVAIGLLGPFAYPIGWSFHGNWKSKTIIDRRHRR